MIKLLKALLKTMVKVPKENPWNINIFKERETALKWLEDMQRLSQ